MKVIKKNSKKIVSIFSFASLMFLSLFFVSCEGDDETFDSNSDVITDLDRGIMEGLLTENYTLDPNVVYSLSGSFAVQEGELTIPAGTNIVAKKGGSNVFLVVLPGAKIFVNGTAEQPVSIGTADGEPGGWSGISIFGNANSTGGRSRSQFLYGPDPVDGSFDNTDNSGSINYLSITGAGNFLAVEERTNGLALYGIGSETEINNISIINSADDAIDIYGGTVSINNLYIENTGAHAINWNEGWEGAINNTFILDKGTDLAILGANFIENESEPIDYNYPTFNNLTIAAATDFVGNAEGDNTVFGIHTEAGAFITGLNVTENIYDVDVNMKDSGDVSNLNINGLAADVTLLNEIIEGATTYSLNSGTDSDQVDLSLFDWRNIN